MITLFNILASNEEIRQALEEHGIDPSTVEHATEHEGGHEGGFHLWNIVTWLSERLHQPWMEENLNVIYSFICMIAVLIMFIAAARKLKRIPSRFQNFIEIYVSAIDSFTTDMLGHKNGRMYIGLVGSLFIYILFMNLFGLVPVIGHSASSNLNITLSLALMVFLVVHAHGLRELGFVGYIKHYLGFPAHGKPSVIDICLAPLMFPLHLVGEFAKPVSLSLRLFGNITGEDVLIFIFVTLIVFVPLHFVVYPIALLGSLIQATVFSMLTTVYIMSMSHHDEH